MRRIVHSYTALRFRVHRIRMIPAAAAPKAYSGERGRAWLPKVMSTIHALAASAARGKLEAFTYDPGSLGDEQVEIDVQYCGICHSDLSMLNNEWQRTQFPFVPGHEAIGTVSAAGRR